MESQDKLEEIFRDLSRGRHISAFDGDIYTELEQHADEYRVLFRRLGFDLVQSARGYFFFHGSSKGTAGGVQKLALFVYILIDWLADNGESIAEAMSGRKFDIEKLPHLASDRYKGYLMHVDVANKDDLVDIVRTLDNLGIARANGDGTFVFLPPVYRIIDACLASGMDINQEDIA